MLSGHTMRGGHIVFGSFRLLQVNCFHQATEMNPFYWDLQ